MNSYKALNKQSFSNGNYSIVPIRMEDKLDIMKWRNDQIYHLRQNKPLTEEDQVRYFETVVKRLFEQQQPNQLLFSYLEGDKCIGYGGLVHINWIDKNAEISFIMNTELEEKCFEKLWGVFLSLLEDVASTELNLHKISTYALDLRPKLYPVLESMGFLKEAVLNKHCIFNNVYVDVVIHSKFMDDNYISIS
jgi:RimJ/RimL family protein N-acetyltransferase